MKKFYNWVGAIDGTHILAMICADQQGEFCNRKRFISQNVLVTCHFDMQFQYVLVGLEAFVTNSHVLDSTVTTKNKGQVPKNNY